MTHFTFKLPEHVRRGDPMTRRPMTLWEWLDTTLSNWATLRGLPYVHFRGRFPISQEPHVFATCGEDTLRPSVTFTDNPDLVSCPKCLRGAS